MGIPYMSWDGANEQNNALGTDQPIVQTYKLIY